MIDENGKAITFLSLEGPCFVTGSLLSKGATAWKSDHTLVTIHFLYNIKEKRYSKIGSVY